MLGPILCAFWVVILAHVFVSGKEPDSKTKIRENKKRKTKKKEETRENRKKRVWERTRNLWHLFRSRTCPPCSKWCVLFSRSNRKRVFARNRNVSAVIVRVLIKVPLHSSEKREKERKKENFSDVCVDMYACVRV